MSLRRLLLCRRRTITVPVFLHRCASNPPQNPSRSISSATLEIPTERRRYSTQRPPGSFSELKGRRVDLHRGVQILIELGDLDAAKKLGKARPRVFTCNAVIAAMCDAKRYSDAIELSNLFFFDKESKIVPDTDSYNLIIKAHFDEGRVDEALQVYRRMLADEAVSCLPSHDSYRILAKGLVDAGKVNEAVDLLRNKRVAADSLVYSTLARGFLDKGDLGKANELFEEFKGKCDPQDYNGVATVNAAFVEWWFKQGGKDEEAMECYRSCFANKRFRLRAATGNKLLEILVKYGKNTEAWELFNQMLEDRRSNNVLAMDSETIDIMVNGCFKLGQFKGAVETLKKAGTMCVSRRCYSNIIKRFCGHMMLSEAESLFAEMCSEEELSPDVATYRTMIDAYVKAGRVDDAFKTMSKMMAVNLDVIAKFAR